MKRAVVTAGCVLVGIAVVLTTPVNQGQVAWALVLPIASLACIALLWE
jgi:hypothetical protein